MTTRNYWTRTIQRWAYENNTSTSKGREYDYSLIPPKCPNCRAMPVNDETPKWMYREHGECHCEETQEEEA